MTIYNPGLDFVMKEIYEDKFEELQTGNLKYK